MLSCNPNSGEHMILVRPLLRLIDIHLKTQILRKFISLPYHFILFLKKYSLSPISGGSIFGYLTIPFSFHNLGCNSKAYMKQHEEYQVFRIYGILGVKNYVSTSRKSTTCFIQVESELTENFYENKGENKLVYKMDIWNSFIAYSSLNNAH
jgi:hypothetical protein